MHARLRFVFIYLIVVMVLAVAGCSNHDMPSYQPTDWSTDLSAGQYFPLNEGTQSIFTLYNADGTTDQLSAEVGPRTAVGYYTAATWYLRLNNETLDTCYLAHADTSLYFFEDKYAAAERILTIPVVAGKTWSRYGDEDIDPGDGGSDDSLVTGGEDDGGGTGLSPFNPGDISGGVARVIPFEGGEQAKVEKIESIQLRNGTTYNSAAKVSVQSASGKWNYYWYVPGYGLTKFVLEATDAKPLGQSSGELIYFRR